MRKKKKQQSKPEIKQSVIEPLTIDYDRTLPRDMLCRYCGKPKGSVWELLDGRLLCGHCRFEYFKGVEQNDR